jgi:PTH2 family peptidyl-tRNA hydrolase
MSRIYLIVNSDLQMSTGKIGAQTAHGMQYIMEYYFNHPNQQKEFRDYKADGSSKIILKAPEQKILALHQKYSERSFLVSDAGRTEIPSGSITVLAFLPMEETLPELKRLRLFT